MRSLDCASSDKVGAGKGVQDHSRETPQEVWSVTVCWDMRGGPACAVGLGRALGGGGAAETDAHTVKRRKCWCPTLCALPGPLRACACPNVSTCFHLSVPMMSVYMPVSFGRLSPPPRPVPCVGNWTWDTAPKAGSRVGC